MGKMIERSTWVICLFLLVGTGSLFTQENKMPADKPVPKVLRDTLKAVINYGADLFNKEGDHAGCYRLYQGSLMSIKPFLGPALQKEIDSAIPEAEQLPRLSDRAMALRKILDKIRQDTAPPAPKKDKPKDMD